MDSSRLTLLAAVEISNGEAVVRKRGVVDSRHTFGDPVADARAWVEQGAQWLHVVDLDALAGQGDNTELIRKVVKAVHSRAHVQLAGGIRDQQSLHRAMTLGGQRIVLDTVALADWEWVCAQFPSHAGRIGMAIDIHAGAVHAPGIALDGAAVESTLSSLQAAHCPRVVVSDIDIEGTRRGPDTELLARVFGSFSGRVDAAGGIAKLEHLHELLALVPNGLEGAVLDAALYEDYFTFAEAIAAIEPRFDPYQWGPAQPWGMTQGL